MRGMSWWTGLEPGVGVVLGGFVTFVATRRTAKDTLKVQGNLATEGLRQDRLLALDQRIWDERFRLYTEFANVTRWFMSYTMPGRKRTDMEGFGRNLGEAQGLYMSIQLVADTEIGSAVHKLVDQMIDVFEAYQSKASLEDIAEARKDYADRLGTVLDKMKDDLRSLRDLA